MCPRIIIVDEHEIFALGMNLMLENTFGVPVEKQFGNVKDAVEYFRMGGPAELILLDLKIPGLDGFSFLEYLKQSHPKVKVLMVGIKSTHSILELCKNFGVEGFIARDSSLRTMTYAIKEVLRGGNYFPALETGKKSFYRHDFFQLLKLSYRLSPSEIRILRHLLDQKENKEVAESLFLSPLTVKTHRKNIYRKLGVHNLAGIVALVTEEVEWNVYQ